MDAQTELPYGGDLNAAIKAGDRAAIRQLMTARDAGRPKPEPVKRSGGYSAASSTDVPQIVVVPQTRLPQKPQYGLLEDGTVPEIGLAVSIQSKGSTVAFGRIVYLDKGDPEIRVELLDGYEDVASELGFKFARAADNNIWILGKDLKCVDEIAFQNAEAKMHQLKSEEVSPEFLSKLEAGTSDFEPTWPGGSWSEKASEECYGLKPGMKFKYMGSTVREHGTVMKIEHVHTGDPSYVWPNSDGPIAIIVKFSNGVRTWIARPSGKLAARYGPTVKEFMKAFRFIPPQQLFVTLQASSTENEAVKLVGLDAGGSHLADVSVDPSTSIEDLQIKLLAINALRPSEDTQTVLALQDGTLLKDLPQEETVAEAFFS